MLGKEIKAQDKKEGKRFSLQFEKKEFL